MELLTERLRIRAAIRRQIPSRKSVQEGNPDRIADLLEEAADEIERLQQRPSDVVEPYIAPEKIQEIFYSADGETYNHSELGDAIDEMLCNSIEEGVVIGNIIYCGVGIKPDPINLCDATDIIDTLGDRAYDWGGEHAYDFPDVSKEATAELNELLKGWYNKHLTVNFWRIDTNTIKEYIITEEDIKERQ